MKKMRRLIPAIAMLLVSAVMLSTASFAWFSMNTDVTASGMQIQAIADSSLVISQAPLTAEGSTAGAPDIKIETGVQKLYPVAYAPGQAKAEDGSYKTDGTNPVWNVVSGATLSGIQAAGWYQPKENENSNIQTGLNKGDFVTVADSAAGFFYVEEFYIAAIDEAKEDATLTLDLSALEASNKNETWKAYAAAIYVVNKTTVDAEGKTVDNPIWKDGVDVVAGTAPDAIIFADDAQENGKFRGIVELPDMDIPSVAGAIDGNTVGLKVIVHFYIDGALMAANDATTRVANGNQYTQADAKYDEKTAYIVVEKATEVADVVVGKTDVSDYYTLSGKVYTPADTDVAAENVTYYALDFAPAVATDEIINAAKVPTTWYTYAVNYIQVPYAYVRTSDVPSTATTLELSFAVADKPVAGN